MFWVLLLAIPFLIGCHLLKLLRNHVRSTSELDLNVWYAHTARACCWIIPAFLAGRCSVHPDANHGGMWNFMTGAMLMLWVIMLSVASHLPTEKDAIDPPRSKFAVPDDLPPVSDEEL